MAGSLLGNLSANLIASSVCEQDLGIDHDSLIISIASEEEFLLFLSNTLPGPILLLCQKSTKEVPNYFEKKY